MPQVARSFFHATFLSVVTCTLFAALSLSTVDAAKMAVLGNPSGTEVGSGYEQDKAIILNDEMNAAHIYVHGQYAQKVDSTGSKLWGVSEKQIITDGDYVDVIAGDIASDGSFVLLIVANGQNSYIQKFDANGDPQWSGENGTLGVFVANYDIPSSVHLGQDGKIYVSSQNNISYFDASGGSLGNVSFNFNGGGWESNTVYYAEMYSDQSDNVIFVTQINATTLVTKMSNTGQILWENEYEIGGIDSSYDGNGGVYFSFITDGQVYAQHVDSNGNAQATGAISGVFLKDTGSSVVIQWNKVTEHTSKMGDYTYQMKINNDGTFDYVYKKMSPNGSDDCYGVYTNTTAYYDSCSGPNAGQDLQSKTDFQIHWANENTFDDSVVSQFDDITQSGGLDLPLTYGGAEYMYTLPTPFTSSEGYTFERIYISHGSVMFEDIDGGGNTISMSLFSRDIDAAPFIPGIQVSSGISTKDRPTTVSNQDGTATIVWADTLGGANYYLKAQKVSSSIVPAWTNGGILISNKKDNAQSKIDSGINNNRQTYSVFSDGANGFVALWSDFSSRKLYMQRISSSGTKHMATELDVKTLSAQGFMGIWGNIASGSDDTFDVFWGEQDNSNFYFQQVGIGNQVKGVSASLDIENADNGNNVEEGSQYAIMGSAKSLRIKDSANGNLLAEISADVLGDLTWSNITGDSDSLSGKSFFHVTGGLSGLEGINGSSYTLYVLKGTGQTQVRICPGASSFDAISDTCAGGVDLSTGTTGQYTVTTVNVSGVDYWKIDGVTGTGGMGKFVVGVASGLLLNPSTADVSQAQDVVVSYTTGAPFVNGDKVRITWENAAGLVIINTCVGSITDADGDGNDDGNATVTGNVYEYLFTADIASGATVSFCANVTAYSTKGSYSVVFNDDNSQFGGALYYVGEDNGVFVTADVAPTLSFNIVDITDFGDSNVCEIGDVTTDSAVNNNDTIDAGGECGYGLAIGTNAANGFTAYVQANGPMSSGNASVANVGDNATFTAGTEAYGYAGFEPATTGRDTVTGVIGSPIIMSGVFANANSSQVPVVNSVFMSFPGGVEYALGDGATDITKVIHGMTIGSGTPAGYYSQTVTYTVTANF